MAGMHGPIIYARLVLTHLGQEHRETYDNARLTGRIADDEVIEAALHPGEDDEKVTHVRVTSVDPTHTRCSRAGSGQNPTDATGPLVVYATEVDPTT